MEFVTDPETGELETVADLHFEEYESELLIIRRDQHNYRLKLGEHLERVKGEKGPGYYGAYCRWCREQNAIDPRRGFSEETSSCENYRALWYLSAYYPDIWEDHRHLPDWKLYPLAKYVKREKTLDGYEPTKVDDPKADIARDMMRLKGTGKEWLAAKLVSAAVDVTLDLDSRGSVPGDEGEELPPYPEFTLNALFAEVIENIKRENTHRSNGSNWREPSTVIVKRRDVIKEMEGILQGIVNSYLKEGLDGNVDIKISVAERKYDKTQS